MAKDLNTRLWERSYVLSRPYWSMYNTVMSSINVHVSQELNVTPEEDRWFDLDEDQLDVSGHEYLSESEEVDDVDTSTNAEYLEFIRQTRQHQKERERMKKEQLRANPESALESYYTDVSQVNTLVADNVVEAPKRSDHLSQAKRNEQDLVNLYGNEAYDKIRSMEMDIDSYFRQKCDEHSPVYWPAMPINPKPYLNQKEY